MARVNVYLPDELAAAARRAQLNLSAVTQSAVRRALAALSTDGWLRTLELARAPGEGPTHPLGLAALDAAREESPTRHE
jgi:post-segregation antitoxin (ccd killing protein)